MLQGHQHRDHVAITPKLWSETKLNQAWGPYFTWQPHQMSLKKFVDRFAADSAQVDALVAEFHAEAASRASTETPMTGFSQDAVAAAKASQTAPEPKGGKRNAQLQQTARLMGIPGHVAKKLL